jgi:hypothetical protein
VFALVLLGLATLNLILCIIDDCSGGAIANSSVFIGFYVRTHFCPWLHSSLSFFVAVSLCCVHG